MDIGKELKASFFNGSVVTRFIYINVGVFMVLRLLNTIFIMAGIDNFQGDVILPWVSAPASLSELILKPWTIITYMFVQFRFLHLLVNMLMLYWFGRLFVQFFSARQMIGVYVLGGLFGVAFYILMYNFVPFYEKELNSAILLGSSGSVLAIISAVAFGFPDREIQMMFIGRVKLLYVGLGAIFIDVIGMTSQNGGGHLAHLGGALAGYLFVSSLKKNRDMSSWIVNLVNTIQGIFKPRKKNMKVKWRRPANEQEYRDQKASNQHEIDRILEKIKKSGYESLSADEKRKLFDASK